MNHFCVGSGFESLGDKPLPRLLLNAPSPGTRVGIILTIIIIIIMINELAMAGK